MTQLFLAMIALMLKGLDVRTALLSCISEYAANRDEWDAYFKEWWFLDNDLVKSKIAARPEMLLFLYMYLADDVTEIMGRFYAHRNKTEKKEIERVLDWIRVRFENGKWVGGMQGKTLEYPGELEDAFWEVSGNTALITKSHVNTRKLLETLGLEDDITATA